MKNPEKKKKKKFQGFSNFFIFSDDFSVLVIFSNSIASTLSYLHSSVSVLRVDQSAILKYVRLEPFIAFVPDEGLCFVEKLFRFPMVVFAAFALVLSYHHAELVEKALILIQILDQ